MPCFCPLPIMLLYLLEDSSGSLLQPCARTEECLTAAASAFPALLSAMHLPVSLLQLPQLPEMGPVVTLFRDEETEAQSSEATCSRVAETHPQGTTPQRECSPPSSGGWGDVFVVPFTSFFLFCLSCFLFFFFLLCSLFFYLFLPFSFFFLSFFFFFFVFLSLFFGLFFSFAFVLFSCSFFFFFFFILFQLRKAVVITHKLKWECSNEQGRAQHRSSAWGQKALEGAGACPQGWGGARRGG